MNGENLSGGENGERRIHGREPPAQAPEDCAGVSLSASPAVTALGMVMRYSIDVLDREGRSAYHLGDSPDVFQARQAWQQAADELKVPALILTPDGTLKAGGEAGPSPRGISVDNSGGHALVTVRRGWLEYGFVLTLVTGLAVILIIGEPTARNAFFMALAAGLLGYAAIGGLSSRFMEIADGRLTAGLRTPFGNLARTDMTLGDIETVLWGRAERRPGRHRCAFVMATGKKVKCFDRLTEEQARWLTRFVRAAIAHSEPRSDGTSP